MKTTKILIAALFLIITATLVFAAKEGAEAKTTELKAEKNMTYGKCVSAGAEIKNTCYNSAKEAEKTCKEQASNSTTKDATKTCSADYKKSMNQCKTEFKNSKNECKKIKHNFFETIGSSMK